jgi:hypothetical protein
VWLAACSSRRVCSLGGLTCYVLELACKYLVQAPVGRCAVHAIVVLQLVLPFPPSFDVVALCAEHVKAEAIENTFIGVVSCTPLAH